MYKLLGFILGAVLLAPLPSLADNLTVTEEYQNNNDLYIQNSAALIRISMDGDDVQGTVWSESGNDWSATETIFTNEGLDFEIEYLNTISELKSDTIVMAYGDDAISYSTDNGFQHYAIPFDEYDVVVGGNKVTFIEDCSGDTAVPQAALWSEADGFGTATDLSNSACTEYLSYYTGPKGVLIDNYTGVAYDRSNNYAVLDTIDLSSLNYADVNDDFDPQGHNPLARSKKNGDVAVGHDTQLYGYSHRQQQWQPLVELEDGFTIVRESEEDAPAVVQTGNTEQIFAFASNDDQTEYQIYRWTSADGWQLEKTYDFSTATELIQPNIDKSKQTLDWAFWEDEENEVRIYHWTEDDGYVKREVRTIDCDGECVTKLDISKKNKVFLTWSTESDITLAAWEPDSDSWEKTILDNDEVGYMGSEITSEGRWIVQYQTDNSLYQAIRWTPDGGWSTAVELAADGIYFNDDKLYYVQLADDGVLTTNRYTWSSDTTTELDSVSDIDTFYDSGSFVYDSYLFLNYKTGDGDYIIDPVELP